MSVQIDVIQSVVLILMVGFAIVAIEAKRLYRAIFGLLGMTVSLGILFFSLSAYQVGIIQLLVYSGGIIALFVMVLSLTQGVEED